LTTIEPDTRLEAREAARMLMTPEAVYERSAMVLAAGRAGALGHFSVNDDALEPTAAYVAGVIRDNYPTLTVPYHARWRHFVVDGEDRWQAIADRLDVEPSERARIRFDLAAVSVLLDAGAGPRWGYRDARTGRRFARSEGLALASLDAFVAGLFSSDPRRPMQADAEALRSLTADALAAAFQADSDNPLDGLDGRVEVLRRLGEQLARAPHYFGSAPGRFGNLFDRMASEAACGPLPARHILVAVLDALAPIWPGRITLGGINLGDTWRHSAVRTGDATDGLIPFHKLSQWLAYSLVEPLEEAGVAVVGLDGLTPLAEYRNGGLLVDCGVIVPKHDGVRERTHAPGDEVVVEWRALTVGLIAELAHHVRRALGRTADEMPLASVLEGGTWAAGRRIAADRRADGGPPIRVVSDGSVF